MIRTFRDNYDIQLTIPNPEQVLSIIQKTPGVEAVTGRTVITGMANTATKSAGVQIHGIDPEGEKEVFRLYETTIPGTGDFFETESRYLEAYIGQELAKELNIIRFIIEDEDLENLAAMEVPEEIINKLRPFSGERFKSEKVFKKELKSILTLKEQAAGVA